MVLIPCRDSLFMEHRYYQQRQVCILVLIPCRDSLFMEREVIMWMARFILSFNPL